MTKGDKIKFAVIGMGHIGKRHADIIRQNPEAELVAVADILSPEELGLKNLKEDFYSSLTGLLNSVDDVDVINICTPNGLHAPQAIEVLNAKKHVVIEKPIALKKADAEKIIFKALQVSRQVFVVMQNRYSPPSVWLKDMIENNRLGNIYSVQLNCYWNRDDRYYNKGNWHGTRETDGGTLFTQFSHFIDMMYWLFGDIENINGKFRNFSHAETIDFEDSGIVHFDFINGGIGSINYSTSVWDKNLESSIIIIGEKGTIKVAGQYMNSVEYCHVKDYDMPALPESNPPNDYGAYKGSAANHHFIIENVINTLKGTSTITTNALEGLKVVEIIERIYQNKPNNLK
ncbi:MAG: Gfo/Idh/MocA family oxidoreductase [Chlorobi bacterium]|nr:Gfo/Idh/MocA family oxidoreductase [Chlorobiota bacterium]